MCALEVQGAQEALGLLHVHFTATTDIPARTMAGKNTAAQFLLSFTP